MGLWGLLDCASEPHAACLKLTGLGTVARKLDSSDNMHLLCTSWMASGSLQGLRCSYARTVRAGGGGDDDSAEEQ